MAWGSAVWLGCELLSAQGYQGSMLVATVLGLGLDNQERKNSLGREVRGEVVGLQETACAKGPKGGPTGEESLGHLSGCGVRGGREGAFSGRASAPG